jgi:hypothetical protein
MEAGCNLVHLSASAFAVVACIVSTFGGVGVAVAYPAFELLSWKERVGVGGVAIVSGSATLGA